MAFKVAINGFGRLGRLVFTELSGEKGVEIVGIGDAAAPEPLAYLLKYDTVPGKYPPALRTDFGPDFLSFRGENFRLCRETDPARLPWRRLGVDVVVDCPGSAGFPPADSREKAELHLKAGAKKVLLAAPVEGVPTVVFSLNEQGLPPRERIFSTAPASAAGLALLIRALHSYAPIESAMALTLRAGDDLFPAGGTFPRLREGAAGIVPAADNNLPLFRRLFPELGEKLAASVRYLPEGGASALILTAVVRKKDLTLEGLNRAMKARSSASFGYTGEALAAADLAGMAHGILFDASATALNALDGERAQVQAGAWYGRESSLAGQLARFIKYLGAQKAAASAKNAPPAKAPPRGKAQAAIPRKPLIRYPS